MGGKGLGPEGMLPFSSRFIMTLFGYCFLLPDVSISYLVLLELSGYFWWTPPLLLLTGFFEGTEVESDLPDEFSWLA